MAEHWRLRRIEDLARHLDGPEQRALFWFLAALLFGDHVTPDRFTASAVLGFAAGDPRPDGDGPRAA